MQQDYLILPQRNSKNDLCFRNRLKPVSYLTNFYQVQLKNPNLKIYQYDIKLDEGIPHDSQLYHKGIISIKKRLRQDVGYLTHKGQMLWGMKNSKIALSIECKFSFEEKQYNLTTLISQRKQLKISELDLNDPTQKLILLQILNISLKQVLKDASMFELGKSSKFFKKNQMGHHHQLEAIGLDVIRGFKFTLVQLGKKICLQIDSCSRVLQSRNLLETIDEKGDRFKQYENATVITRYGMYKTYEIDQIALNLNPESTFFNQKKGVKMTYSEYYKDVYGLTVTNTKQPLLKVVSRYNKQIKEGKMIKKPEYIYLMPQFVSLTGMTQEQTRNFKTMQLLAEFTKLKPHQRMDECRNIVDTLNNSDSLLLIKDSIRMEGFTLPKPTLSGASKIEINERGLFKNRGELKECVGFRDWIIAYSKNKRSVQDIVDTFKSAGKAYRLQFTNPTYLQIKGRNEIQNWKLQISKQIYNCGLPQILLIVLEPYQEKLYSQLKSFITNQIKCSSQFLRKRPFEKSKYKMSAASKICIQMNVKIGATPWTVESKHEYFEKRTCMYGALSLSKGKHGKYTLAFVGTINDSLTKVYSRCKTNINAKQCIPINELQNIFVSWAKNFYLANKKLPKIIILYREGLSDSQAKDQLSRSEIPALEAMIQMMKEKTQTHNYHPELMVVIANKKINSRFFNAVGQGNKPRLMNPDSGSVIVESMSSNGAYDFHLASQYVSQGTCTPTRFRVAYDSTEMPEQALIEFTFNQCFNYYNWEGAVRVPACLQCANKLAKLVGDSSREEQMESELNKKYFFL